MKRLVAITLLVLFCQATCALGAAARADNSHAVTWRQLSRSEWQLDVVLPALTMDSLTLSGVRWTDIHVEGLPKNSHPGEPALPFISVWIPADVSVGDFSLISEQTHATSCAPPLPAPEFLDRAVEASLTYLPNEDLYAQSTPFPSQLVETVCGGLLGRSNMTLVRVNPLFYVPASRELTVYDRLSFVVSLSRGQSLDANSTGSQYENDFMADLARTNQQNQPPADLSSPRMWIVTQPEYVDLLTEWRAFKRTCGIPSELIIYSEVASTSATLKNYLQSQFDQAETPPEFLFIIGDHEDIPAFYGVGSSLTDHPYSCLSGSDYLPDISVGRLPVQSATQLSQWLNRALAYERDGQVSQSGNATVFSSSVALDPQHGLHVDALFESGGLNSTRLQQPQSGALPLLIASLTEQPLWTFYIGHGTSTAWSSVAPHFTDNSLPQIQDSRPAIVVSVACATADFDEPQQSIAEEWTLDLLNGGALCYIGATESTAFFFSDTIGIATLEAVFEHGYTSVGKALDYGKLRCAESFPQGPGELTEETIQQFELLGDPSLRPFTRAPVVSNVTVPEVVPVGTAQIPITVLAGGHAVTNADVILSSPTTPPRLTQTNSDGLALVTLPFSSEHAWTIVVRGSGIMTVERTVTVVPIAGPLVQLQEIELDESSGDMDGHADRGESGTLRVLLRNAGTAVSTPATLRLECSSSALAISPLTLSVPALAPQTEDWLDATASYSISSSAQNGAAAVIQAWLGTGTNARFAGSFSILLQAPQIELESQSLSELEGDGDGLPEAGEQLELVLTLVNRGGEPLRLPAADCLPDHNYLHIQNTRWTADSIDAGATETVTFDFVCDSITPRGFPFEYNVALTAANNDDQDFWGRYRIGQVPVLLYVLDSEPQQVPGIVGALDVLGIEHETATVLPTDLSRYASIWIFCGVHPNQQPLSTQSAQRIAAYLDDGGACYWEGGDVWAFDYQTALHPYFGIEGVSDGYGDAGPIAGVRGRFTDGMEFSYSGENSFIDRIQARDGAFEILNNDRSNAVYCLGVANAGETYRTVGASIELGALNDAHAPSTRVHLIRSILEWFEIPVLHDLTPPVITHIPIGAWHHPGAPIPIFADVQDESEIDFVACDYRINNGGFETVSMQGGVSGYSAQLPAQPLGTTVYYRLRAADRSLPSNTTVTDEYQLVVENYADRIVEITPVAETLNWMRKRGSNGTFSLIKDQEGERSIVLMGEEPGRVSTYVTTPFDLSSFASPTLSFCSMLTGHNTGETSAARILASTDNGTSFPILIWRADDMDAPGHNWIEEGGLNALAGQNSVVLKFVYYANKYWEISQAQISEGTPKVAPARNLIVIPGEIIGLKWSPSTSKNATYKIYAAPSLQEPFIPIAVTTDTTYDDHESASQNQRFYRVEAIQESGPSTVCKRADSPIFEKTARSFLRRTL